MKTKSNAEIGPSEYDLTTVRPNPYAERIELYGSNLVVIEPELYAAFPSAEAVNEALRLVVKAAALTRQPQVEHQKAS